LIHTFTGAVINQQNGLNLIRLAKLAAKEYKVRKDDSFLWCSLPFFAERLGNLHDQVEAAALSA
jgi:hypothetical protein